MAKIIKLLHPTPKPAKNGLALIPVGLYCNVALQKAKPGDIVEFWTDWRHDTRKLVNKCRVAVNSSFFTFITKSIYGQHILSSDILKRWEAQCIIEGIGKDGFSREECLLIEAEKINEEQ